MKYSNNTPGPWHVEDEFIFGNGIRVADTTAHPDDAVSDSELEANAKLIACAPELLDAAKCALADLEGIMPEFEPSGDREHPGWTTIEELKAVIQKATT